MNWEIFRDQIWNFIGVIIALLTILTTLIIYFLQRRKKEMTYDILSRNSLLSTREKLEGKIKVLYNENVVENVNFFELKISNVGNLGIPSEDYERPIRFIFDSNSEILSAEIIETSPISLNTQLEIINNELLLNPVLMNSKDYFIIKAIIANSENTDVLVDARIKDVKEVKMQGEKSVNIVFAIIGVILTITGFIQIGRIESSSQVDTPWTLEKTISISLVVIGYIFMIVFMSKSRTYRKIFKKMFKALS